MTASPPSRLWTIEAGRGLAALLVVLFHASSAIFPAPKYWNTHIFGRVFDFGYAGVEFFFVLSGFIIAYVHAGDIGAPARLSHYARRRFVRIYPVYWVVLAGMVALVTLPLGLGVAPPRNVVIESAFLIGHSATATLLAVAWTLYHEVAFYLVFGMWIIDRRIGAAVTLVWLALVLANLAGVALPAALPPYLASPLNLLFGFGVAAWAVSHRVGSRFAIATAVIAAVAFVCVGVEAVYFGRLPEAATQLGFGVAAAVGLAAVVALERARAVAVPKLVLLLGAASYSIYLTHYPLLSLLAKIAVRSGIRDTWPPQLAFMAVVAVAAGLGVAFHKLVEKPLLRLGSRALGLVPRQAGARSAAK